MKTLRSENEKLKILRVNSPKIKKWKP